ncbi:riboflavin synthase subunit alpha [Halobacteriales archaeon QS_8_69_26]|nr:MAG: riboflavin synthase subunit alpha [Halobacteriales archaeon QS_8_69_26]
MFTGIVEGTGVVTDVAESEDGRRMRVAADVDDLEVGQSVAINGACLTVESHGHYDGDPPSVGDLDPDDLAGTAWFEVFLAEETVDRTYFDRLGPGDRVNVERALRADDRLDGHFVQGHVDGTAEVVDVREVGEDWVFEFSLPDDLRGYVVEKGSIAVDGISLTVADLDESEDAFTIAIIPETYRVTTLSDKAPGDPVHLEADVVAKYVESLVDR